MRNKIDLYVEGKLLKLESDGESSDEKRNLVEKMNSKRDAYVDELKKFETECYDKLERLIEADKLKINANFNLEAVEENLKDWCNTFKKTAVSSLELIRITESAKAHIVQLEARIDDIKTILFDNATLTYTSKDDGLIGELKMYNYFIRTTEHWLLK
jgi:hypothetical protein